MNLAILPSINASLNAATTLFLVLGFIFIRRRVITAHKACMLTACVTSTLFLISYLYYHYHHGTTRFPGHGLVKFIYLSILLTHTVLAALIVPFVIFTLFMAFKANFIKHAKIARWTLPLWLYVSVTGVVIYWMLYQIKYLA